MATDPKRVVLIHALSASIAPIETAFAERWPAARIVNLMDDSLSVDRAAAGELTEAMVARFCTLARYARDTGADAILFTCSAFHHAIDVAKAGLGIPVLKPDEAMMESALACGERVTLLATFEPTLATARAELEAVAAAGGRKVSVTTVHVPGALAALQSGDAATHARLIAERAAALPPCDALAFAQFSMAPTAAAIIAAGLPNLGGARVLTTPDTAVEKLKKLLEG